jgi:hypothetical protein
MPVEIVERLVLHEEFADSTAKQEFFLQDPLEKHLSRDKNLDHSRQEQQHNQLLPKSDEQQSKL